MALLDKVEELLRQVELADAAGDLTDLVRGETIREAREELDKIGTDKSDNGHTPGPWNVEFDSDIVNGTFYFWPDGVFASGVLVESSPKAFTKKMYAKRICYFDDTSEKDAYMIAASPTMYDELKIAVQLARVAIDWNLLEVEVDGEMVRTTALLNDFTLALNVAESGWENNMAVKK